MKTVIGFLCVVAQFSTIYCDGLAIPHDVYGVPLKYIPLDHQDVVVPLKTYGVPAIRQEYGVPKQEYGIPKHEYGIPKLEYGVPKVEIVKPVISTYSFVPLDHVEVAKPKEVYGVPPATSYGVPITPHDSYGLPVAVSTVDANSITSAKSSFSRSDVPIASEEYGIPKETPNPPDAPIKLDIPIDIRTISESKQVVPIKPHEEYGIPAVPHKEYGIPKDDVKVEPVVSTYSYSLPAKVETPVEAYVPAKPHDEYGVPKESVTPVEQPHVEYGIPKAPFVPEVPHVEYGVPKEVVSVVPQQEYGAPAAPHSEYGVPKEPVVSTYSYSLPAKVDVPVEVAKPHDEYGVPKEVEYDIPKTPVVPEVPLVEYGVPKEVVPVVPHQDYGVPAVPHTEYGIPKEIVKPLIPVVSTYTYSLPTQSIIEVPVGTYTPSKPHDEYGLPKTRVVPHAEYGIPKEVPTVPHQEYGVPKDAVNEIQPVVSSYSYVLPTQTVVSTPVQAYGVPKVEYGIPKAEYGVPKVEYGVPKVEYGVPKVEYGVPKVEYGVPKVEVPAPEYGLPAVTIRQPEVPVKVVKPHEVYGVPTI